VSSQTETSQSATAAQLEDLLRQRYSCRSFRATPVPRDVIFRILGMAQRSPSWCNCQPWNVVLLSGRPLEELRDALYRHVEKGGVEQPDFAFPREYQGKYLQRRRESGFQLYDALAIRRGDRAAYGRQVLENFRFFGAPHLAIVSTDEAIGIYGAVDCGIYVGTFMLAAQAFGVSTVPQAALAGHSGFLRTHLGLDAAQRVVCGISFGYDDAGHPANSYRTRRADIAEAVDWRE
jgi:nitroreductase